MKEHFSLTRSRPYVFIPINLTREGPQAKGLPGLCVIDTEEAVRHEGIHAKLWRTSGAGTVHRIWTDKAARSPDTGRYARIREPLILFLKGLPPFSPMAPSNNDPLDVRLGNFTMLAHVPAVREASKLWKPGSVVSQLPGYNEAMNELKAFPDFYMACAARHRAARMADADVLKFLSAVQEGPMRGQSCGSLVGYMEEEYGVRMHANQIRQILNGQSLHQYGFNYEALKRTRPSPRERALERWKQRTLAA